MIRDDQIHALLPAEAGLLTGGDSAVHGDDQTDALGLQTDNGLLIEAVALLDPPGDIAGDLTALAPEKLRQQAGGGDAIHIVVAKDRDVLPP